MREKMKNEIINGYKELIKNCKDEIKKDINKDSNEYLLKEYSEILSEVISKSDSYYKDLEKKRDEIYEVSILIENFLNPIKPYTERNG